MTAPDYSRGCTLPLDQWIWLNRVGIFEDQALRPHVSPFPPVELMGIVSGVQVERDFAQHGADFYRALAAVSPKPLTEYRKLLDFGCGCGRLARMFKGHPHQVFGCDIDPRLVQWVRDNLLFMQASLSSVKPPLPFASNQFDAIISISVFTHLNEATQDAFLSDLQRISCPNANLFLTVHGQRALDRAWREEAIRKMICVDEDGFQRATREFNAGEHAFILQHGHLTSPRHNRPWYRRWLGRSQRDHRPIRDPYEYGITFIPEDYIRRHWSRWFKVISYHSGAIHDFQDIALLSPKK